MIHCSQNNEKRDLRDHFGSNREFRDLLLKIETCIKTEIFFLERDLLPPLHQVLQFKTDKKICMLNNLNHKS